MNVAGHDGVPDVSVFQEPSAELLRAGVLDAPARPGLAGSIARYDVLRVVGLARDSASGRQGDEMDPRRILVVYP